MAKKHDTKVGEIVAKIHELGLSYKEGAKKFGVKPWVLYDYNRKGNRDSGVASVPATAKAAQGEAPEDIAAGPVALPGDVGDLIRT